MQNIKLFKPILLAAFVLLTSAAAFAQDLIISTAQEWNNFADAVNNGTESYEGKTVKLAADITVSTMVGTKDNKFKGTFLGDGYTLTFNLGTESEQFDEDYAAPFRYVNGATIEALHVAGDVYTSERYVSGFFSAPEGNCTVNRCHSSIIIHSTFDGDGTHGGFVGYSAPSSATITFNNCLFDGSILGDNTTKCGGFVGWHNGEVHFNNCLMAGKLENSVDENSATFSRNGVTSISDSYYKTAYGTAQGTDGSEMSNAKLLEQLGSAWKASKDQQGNDIVVPIMGIPEGLLSDNDGYYINMPANGGETNLNFTNTKITTFKVYDDGGKDGDYSNSYTGTLVITVPDGYVLRLSGSIATEDWDKLTVYKGSGTTGEKIIDEISGSRNVDVVCNNRSMTIYFKSDDIARRSGLDLTVHFDKPNDLASAIVSNLNPKYQSNNGNAINLGYTVTAFDGTLLTKDTHFYETIKEDDQVVTSIIENGSYTLTITGISPYIGKRTFNFTVSDLPGEMLSDADGYYVNMPENGKTTTLTFYNDKVSTFKVYDDGGKEGDYSNSYTGTLVITVPDGYVLRLSGSIATGQDYDKLTVYKGSGTTGEKIIDGISGSQKNVNAVCDNRSMTIYFRSDRATTCSGLDLTVQFGKTNDLAVVNISGIQALYRYTGSEITLEYTVTTVDGTTLRAGKDYEAVIKNSENNEVTSVKDLGEYTLTITGKDSYTGSQTIKFTVVEIIPELTEGSCIVTKDITISERINVYGDVEITLNDGVTLTASKGITVNGGSLTIKAQSTDADKMGSLIAYADGQDAAIGGKYESDFNFGTINILGGKITAKSQASVYVAKGAGIGGTGSTNGTTGTINLKGGIINAQGIGSGSYNDNNNITVNIYDGVQSITATRIYDDGGECIGLAKDAGGTVDVNFLASDGTKLTDEEKGLVFYDSGEGGDERQISLKPAIHSVKIAEDYQSIITASTVNAIPGEEVSLNTFPYAITELKLNGSTFDYTTRDGKCFFTMPDYDVEVSASVSRVSPLDLSQATGDFTAIDGDILTGSTEHNISIDAGASITLNNAALNGIKCQGSATITIQGDNSVTGDEENSGIDADVENTTLTIQGDGSLTAQNIYSAGGIRCKGGLKILSGTITGEGGISASTVTICTDITKIETIYRGISGTIKYMDGDNDVTANKESYFTTTEDDYEKTVIVPKYTTNQIGALTITEKANGTKTAVIDDDAYEEGKPAYALDAKIDVQSISFLRTFKGTNSTFIFPFKIPAGNYSGGTFCRFSTVEYNKKEQKWIAEVIKLEPSTDDIQPNTPYIFQPDNGSAGLTISGPITLEANISGGVTQVEYSIDGATDSHWKFVGVYQQVSWPNGNPRVYGFAGSAKTTEDGSISIGDFVRAGENSFVRPFRCYLEYDQDELRKTASVLPDRIEVRVISGVIDPTDQQTDPSGDIETPTSEITKQNVNVWSFDKTIYIAAAPNTQYTIVDVNGRQLCTGITATDRDEIHLRGNADGMVIVRIANQSFKIRY